MAHDEFRRITSDGEAWAAIRAVCDWLFDDELWVSEVSDDDPRVELTREFCFELLKAGKASGPGFTPLGES